MTIDTSFVAIAEKHGIWVVVVGIIMSIIIGLVKIPIRAKAIPDTLSEEVKKKRETVFDIVTFLSTYVTAFIGAVAYYPISTGGFNILEVLTVSAGIWMSEALTYAMWKKMGIKWVCTKILHLFIKDKNGDGKISLQEAVESVKDAFKKGELDVGSLLGSLDEAKTEADAVEEAENNAVEAEEAVEGENPHEATQEVTVTYTTASGDKIAEVASTEALPGGAKTIKTAKKLDF